MHLLTDWPFLIGEKCGMVAPIHVSHAYIVTISPVQLPEEAGEDYQTLLEITDLLAETGDSPQ